MPVATAKTSVFHVMRQPGNPDYEGSNYGWDLVWENGQPEWWDSLTQIRTILSIGQSLHRGLHPEGRGVRALPFGKEPGEWQVYWSESTRQPSNIFTVTLDAAMGRYPDLYPTQNHFLFGVFLVGGTGWKWRGGVLVNDGYKRPEKVTPNPVPEHLTEAIEEARLLLAELGEAVDVEHTLPKRLLLDDSVPIANLPDDILPEWLNAAQDALALASSNHFERTVRDNEILTQVKARIGSLNA